MGRKSLAFTVLRTQPHQCFFSFSCKCDKQTSATWLSFQYHLRVVEEKTSATDAVVLSFKPYEFLGFWWVWLFSGPVLDVLEYRNSFYHSPEAVCVEQFVQFQASVLCKLSLSQWTPAVFSFLKLATDSNKKRSYRF